MSQVTLTVNVVENIPLYSGKCNIDEWLVVPCEKLLRYIDLANAGSKVKAAVHWNIKYEITEMSLFNHLEIIQVSFD